MFSGVSDFTPGRDAGIHEGDDGLRLLRSERERYDYQHNVGFGVAFLEVEPRFLRVLQKWLRLAKEKYESRANHF